MYKIKDLHFSYPGSGKEVLSGVDMELASGEVVSILGPNGAGKSTLLGCMLGLLKPDRGSILLGGKPLKERKPSDIARIVSYVPQNNRSTFGYSVFDYVLMGRAPLVPAFSRPSRQDREAAGAALERMGLSHLSERSCTQISGGERQQAAIARAIVRNPRVILFDEPTAHLDFGNQIRTLRVIKSLAQEGYAIVITTHTPDHAILLGGNAAILDRSGHLTKGEVSDIITEPVLSEVYKEKMLVRYVEELGRVTCLPPNL